MPDLSLRIVLLALFCAVLSACNQSDPGPSLPQLDPDARILAYGDSLTWGNGAKRDEAYPKVLGDLIGREVVTVANPNDQTATGAKKIATVLDSVRPDLMLLGMGSIDFLRRVSPEETKANLNTMIQQASQRQIPTVLIGIPEIGASGSAPLYTELAKTHDLVLLEGTIGQLLQSKSTQFDPVHPNAQGYRQLAEAVAQRLREAGAL